MSLLVNKKFSMLKSTQDHGNQIKEKHDTYQII